MLLTNSAPFLFSIFAVWLLSVISSMKPFSFASAAVHHDVASIHAATSSTVCPVFFAYWFKTLVRITVSASMSCFKPSMSTNPFGFTLMGWIM